MIAVIDNYDSFTYNLVQFLGEIVRETPLPGGEEENRHPRLAQRRHRGRRADGTAAEPRHHQPWAGNAPGRQRRQQRRHSSSRRAHTNPRRLSRAAVHRTCPRRRRHTRAQADARQGQPHSSQRRRPFRRHPQPLYRHPLPQPYRRGAAASRSDCDRTHGRGRADGRATSHQADLRRAVPPRKHPDPVRARTCCATS